MKTFTRNGSRNELIGANYEHMDKSEVILLSFTGAAYLTQSHL